MSKITTNTIKNLIPAWLHGKDCKAKLDVIFVNERTSQESIDEYFGKPYNLTLPAKIEDVRDAIWKNWLSTEWKRWEKKKLGDDDYLEENLFEDFAGSYDEVLLKRYSEDEELMKKCCTVTKW